MARKTVARVDGVPIPRKEWKHKKLYEAWKNMIRRCYDPSCRSYSNYGARGIYVCDEWRADFYKFAEYMGPAPEKWSSIDRFPDNDDGYRPGNLRWATQAQQMRNRRNTLLIPWEGEMLPAVDVAERIGADPLPFARYLWQRIFRQSYTPAEAIEEYGIDGRGGDRKRSNSTLLRIKNGPVISLQEAAAQQGLDYDSMNSRYYRGSTIAGALGLDDKDVEIIQEVRRKRKATTKDEGLAETIMISINDERPIPLVIFAELISVPARLIYRRWTEYAKDRDEEQGPAPTALEGHTAAVCKTTRNVRTGSLDQNRLDL